MSRPEEHSNRCIKEGQPQDVARRPMGGCPADRVLATNWVQEKHFAIGNIFTDMFAHEVPFFDTLGFVVCICLYAYGYTAGHMRVNDRMAKSEFTTKTFWRDQEVVWMEKWLDPEDYPQSVGCTVTWQENQHYTHTLSLQYDQLGGPCYHDGNEKFALQKCRLNQYCMRKLDTSDNSFKPVCQLKPIEENIACNTSIFFPRLCELMKPNCWMNSSCLSNVSLSAYQDPDQLLPLATYIKWPVTDSVKFSYYANQEPGENVYVSLTCLERGQERGSKKFEHEARTFQADDQSIASGDVTFHICLDTELFRISIATDQGDSYYTYGVPFVFDVAMEPEEKKLRESTSEDPVRTVKCKIDLPFMITDLFRVRTWWSLSSTGRDLKTDELNGDLHISSSYRCNVLVKFQSTFPRMELEEYKHRELRIYLSGAKNTDFNKTIQLMKYKKRKTTKVETDILSNDVLMASIIASGSLFGLGLLFFVYWYGISIRRDKIILGPLKRKSSKKSRSSTEEDEAEEPLLEGQEAVKEATVVDLEGLDNDEIDATEKEKSIEIEPNAEEEQDMEAEPNIELEPIATSGTNAMTEPIIGEEEDMETEENVRTESENNSEQEDGNQVDDEDKDNTESAKSEQASSEQ